MHTETDTPDDSVNFSELLRVSAVVTQTIGDGIGDDIVVDDDGPTVTLAATPAQVDNAAGQSGTGDFGYDIGTDEHDALFYDNDGWTSSA